MIVYHFYIRPEIPFFYCQSPGSLETQYNSLGEKSKEKPTSSLRRRRPRPGLWGAGEVPLTLAALTFQPGPHGVERDRLHLAQEVLWTRGHGRVGQGEEAFAQVPHTHGLRWVWLTLQVKGGRGVRTTARGTEAKAATAAFVPRYHGPSLRPLSLPPMAVSSLCPPGQRLSTSKTQVKGPHLQKASNVPGRSQFPAQSLPDSEVLEGSGGSSYMDLKKKKIE